MKEIELKLQIPDGRLAAVRQALHEQRAERMTLCASYLDTPDRSLSRRRCALRVRQEGALRVQTFKGAGADAMTRLEENRPAPSALAFDLSLHGAAVRTALRQALPQWHADRDPSGLDSGLMPVYETRFERLQCVLASPAGKVLACLDEGDIRAGQSQTPLAEIEFELLEGSALAVIETARRWSGLFGLWLDVQSKALKGTRLAQESATGQPVAASVPMPSRAWIDAGARTPTSESRRAWMSELLDLCAGPMSDIAQGRPQWPLALQSWAQTLHRLRHAHAVLPTLPCAWLAATHALTGQIDALLARILAEGLSAAPDPALTLEARALATQAASTGWALDLLDLIHEPAHPTQDRDVQR